MGMSMRVKNQNSLPGPEDTRRVILENGIVVLSRENLDSHSVVIQGYLPAGSLFEPIEKLGLANFTAQALMRGTKKQSFQQIYDALESAGASLSFGGRVHTTTFGGKALAEDLRMLLGITAEALRQPVFPEDQVERLRAQLITNLAIRAQDTGMMASLAFDQIVYAKHPYRNPESGYENTVSGIQRADLVEYHKRVYGPVGMVIVIVGAIKPDNAIEMVTEIFGDWQNPSQPAPPTLPGLQKLLSTTREDVKIPGKFQSDLIIGVAGPTRKDPEFMAAALGNNILGQFGMMGRIGESVREKSGLAYYASSSLSGGLGPAPWYISAGVAPENVDRTIDLITEEIRLFTTKGVTPEELADSKANFIGSLPLSLESNYGVAGALVGIELFDLGLDYYYHYPELINSVTADQIQEASRRFLEIDRLAIAVAGS